MGCNMWMTKGGIVRFVPEYDVSRFKNMGFKEVKNGGKSNKKGNDGGNTAGNANAQTSKNGGNEPEKGDENGK